MSRLDPLEDVPPEQILEEIRDDFGTLRVTEAGAYRFLYFGEQTEQSCTFTPDPAWLEYDYTRAMLLALFWQPRPQKVTLLGLGGGSLANCVLTHFAPGQVTAVELRPAVVDAGFRWLGLSQDSRLNIKIGCAEQYINESPASCDLLFVDLYLEGGISRLQLQAEFFARCHQALRPGGLLVINQWQLGESGQPYAGRMLQQLFGDAYLQVPVEEGNILLLVPESGQLFLEKLALRAWADDLEPQLGYSLRPYIEALRRASDGPAFG
ncbi:spermidine synthase [Halopseudomonas sp.]|uniref:spermine/spermidine synthase domain-containing protein n=1 Tax=Halopseudomonas sp. TaxID=2901191 RepID=UPI00356A7763